nr:MAG TPA_asm: hypothetical protein [Caudoviricetes sp.]
MNKRLLCFTPELIKLFRDKCASVCSVHGHAPIVCYEQRTDIYTCVQNAKFRYAQKSTPDSFLTYRW